MRRLIWLVSFALMSSCAAPESARMMPKAADTGADATVMAEPAPIAEANILPNPEHCAEDGDGIGGTGCPIR